MTLRQQLLSQLVNELHHEPLRLYYRKKPFGKPVTGWDSKLRSYFWPDPATNYAATHTLLEPWFSEAGQLSQRLLEGQNWTSEERTQAKDLAWEVLKWGGVTRQSLFSEDTVEAVFRRALGFKVSQPVPMNSGWTKVAALATAYLEDKAGARAHVIWDSRVSTSLVTRLDKLLVDAGHYQPKKLFPKIGPVTGRGGTRPRTFKLAWSHAYGSWQAQEAGSVLVRELRDLLNQGGYPPMPLPGGGSRPWTVRGVESVLFMDGY